MAKHTQTHNTHTRARTHSRTHAQNTNKKAHSRTDAHTQNTNNKSTHTHTPVAVLHAHHTGAVRRRAVLHALGDGVQRAVLQQQRECVQTAGSETACARLGQGLVRRGIAATCTAAAASARPTSLLIPLLQPKPAPLPPQTTHPPKARAQKGKPCPTCSRNRRRAMTYSRCAMMAMGKVRTQRTTWQRESGSPLSSRCVSAGLEGGSGRVAGEREGWG